MAESARPGLALLRERERERPPARSREPAPRGGPMRHGGLGDEPEVAAGSRRVCGGRRRAASHLNDVAAIPYFPRPLPTRPPTRPLAAGCCEAALPRPDRERQCLPARHSPRVPPAPRSTPPLPRGRRCSPAQRRAGERSGGGGKGLRTRGAASRTRRRGPGLDALHPLSEQVKAAGGRRGGGSGREGIPEPQTEAKGLRQRRAALRPKPKSPNVGAGAGPAGLAAWTEGK